MLPSSATAWSGQSHQVTDRAAETFGWARTIIGKPSGTILQAR